MLVLEQFAHHIERLAVGNVEKLASQSRARQQRLALFFWQRLGIALRQENLRRDLLGLAVPFAESRGVFLGKSRDIGDGFLQIAAEHQRGAIAMRLAELVPRRDVGDAFVEVQVLEPGRLADVEMIDRMQVVVEARQRDFARAQSAAISEPTVDQQNVEPGAGEITPKDQPVVPGADNDAVIGLFQRLGQRSNFPLKRGPQWASPIDCRALGAAVNARDRMANKPELVAIFRAAIRHATVARGGRFAGLAGTLGHPSTQGQSALGRNICVKLLLVAGAALVLAAGPATAQQKSIKIGFISTFSGPVAAIGNDMRNSFELALDHMGRKMGGLPVEVIYEDDGFKPKSASRRPTS